MKNKFLKNFSIIEYFWLFVLPFFFIITLIYVVMIWHHNMNNSISTLKNQSSRIEKSFSESADYTAYLMDYINSRIVDHGAKDLKYIKNLLSSFRLDESVNNNANSIIPWNIFSWVNDDMKLIVSSDKGIVDPIDMSDRGYVRNAFKNPNVMNFGDLRLGVVSQVMVVPVAMSVFDENNKAVGAMVFGFYLDRLVNKLSNSVNSKGISFALLDENLKIVAHSDNFINDEEITDGFNKVNINENNNGILTEFKVFSSKGVLRYYQKINKYPYYIVTQYDRDIFMDDLSSKILPYFLQLFSVLVFLFVVVIGFKKLIVNPVSKLSLISKTIAADHKVKISFPRSKVREINQLSKSILSVKKFVKNEDALKKKIIKANEDLQSLTRSISHDIRNYIFGISGLANLVLERKLETRNPHQSEFEKEEEEILKIIIHQSEEVGYFIEDLLDNSQIQVGNFTLKDMIDCDISALMQKVILVNKSFAIDNKVKLIFEDQDNLPPLKCDPRRMRQIFVNLISNSIKYNKEDGEVRIILREENNHIYIEIADTGIGMNDDEIEMALKGQGRKINKYLDRKSHIESHGIGMLIIKHLVELHEGKIEIESKKNVGTRVKLWFKASDSKRNIQIKNKDQQNIQISSPNNKEVKILIVDDNHLNLTIIKGVLRRENYQVIEAINGVEAIAILDKIPEINLIIMDGKMPMMDGYETTQFIRNGVGFKNFKNYKIPIIGLMGDGDDKTVKKALESGMNEHVQKGSPVIKLMNIVKRYIDNKSEI